jgi:hypothetical protein
MREVAVDRFGARVVVRLDHTPERLLLKQRHEIRTVLHVEQARAVAAVIVRAHFRQCMRLHLPLQLVDRALPGRLARLRLHRLNLRIERRNRRYRRRRLLHRRCRIGCQSLRVHALHAPIMANSTHARPNPVMWLMNFYSRPCRCN